MSKEASYFPPEPTPPPHYLTPKMSEGHRTQYTGSSRTPYDHELDDIQRRQPFQSREYDDAHYRWRRGVENDMPYRPPQKSKLANIFATCCCGSVWGIIAWVVGLILVVGGVTALIVKTMLPHSNEASSPISVTSIVTLTPPSSTNLPASVTTMTVTTSSAEPSTTTSVETTVSISTYTPPEASTITVTTESPTPSIITSMGTVTSTLMFSSTAVSTETLRLKTSDPEAARTTERVTTKTTVVSKSNAGASDGHVEGVANGVAWQ